MGRIMVTRRQSALPVSSTAGPVVVLASVGFGTEGIHHIYPNATSKLNVAITKLGEAQLLVPSCHVLDARRLERTRRKGGRVDYVARQQGQLIRNARTIDVLDVRHHHRPANRAALEARQHRNRVQHDVAPGLLVPQVRGLWLRRLPILRNVHGRARRRRIVGPGCHDMAEQDRDGAVPATRLDGSRGLERLGLEAITRDRGAEESIADLAALGESVSELEDG